MNNEPSVVSQSRVEETDFSILKIVILALFSIGTSMAMVYEIREFLASFQYAFLWFAVIALLMFLVLNILSTFFIKRFSIIVGIAFLETCLPLVFFLERVKTDTWPIAIGFFLFFIFVFAGIQKGRSYLKNSITIKFFSTAKMVTPRLVTGVLAGVSIVFYLQCFSVGGMCVGGIGKEVINQVLDFSKPVVNLWIPNVSPDQSVSEFFHQLAISEAGKVYVGTGRILLNTTGGVSEIPTVTRDKIVEQFSTELKSNVEKQTGPLNVKNSVKDEVFRIISEYIKKLSSAMQTLVSLGFAVLFFFSVKGIAFLFYWLINLIAFLVYKLLVAAEFANISYETRNREFVILP